MCSHSMARQTPVIKPFWRNKSMLKLKHDDSPLLSDSCCAQTSTREVPGYPCFASNLFLPVFSGSGGLGSLKMPHGSVRASMQMIGGTIYQALMQRSLGPLPMMLSKGSGPAAPKLIGSSTTSACPGTNSIQTMKIPNHVTPKARISTRALE